MRSNVGLKLGIWLALFGIVSNSFTGYYIYIQSREMLSRAAEQKLLTATQVLARRVNHSLDQAINDVRLIAALPGVLRLADPRRPGANRPADERALEEVFASMLASHAEYFQIRIIGAGDFGREVVRVDRANGGIEAVRGAGLQEKGHFPYVHESLALPTGEFYFSQININREVGAHQGLHKPTLRIATPIRYGGADAWGTIVINIDLEGMFSRMRIDIPADISVYVTNNQGDYLIHPDAGKAFGFDRGRRFRVQDDIPGMDAVFERRENNLVLTVPGKESAGESVTAFVRTPFGDRSSEHFLIVGLAMPLNKVLQDSHALALNIIQIAIILSTLALVVSMALSRVLTQPLNTMARAISRFEAGKPLKGLPVDRNDEIGYLAKSFQAMTARLNMQVGDLQDRQLQLDYMAHHDQLTNLPNRILFLDRLIQAINTAHRNSQQFAVMFIDLDKFKEINDTYGHHVGDEVLKTAATRMKSLIRQEDTISRLGGDEFTIILRDLRHAEQYTVVAEKVLMLFDTPFRVEGHALQLSCSIGISIYPQHGTQAEELLKNADAAMYQAKKNGRNGYLLYAAE